MSGHNENDGDDSGPEYDEQGTHEDQGEYMHSTLLRCILLKGLRREPLQRREGHSNHCHSYWPSSDFLNQRLARNIVQMPSHQPQRTSYISMRKCLSSMQSTSSLDGLLANEISVMLEALMTTTALHTSHHFDWNIPFHVVLSEMLRCTPLQTGRHL